MNARVLRVLAWGWALVLVVCGVRLLALPAMNAVGVSALHRGEQTTAARWFDRNTVANPLERWVAPYNRGVARYTDRDWVSAAADFRMAQQLAPEAQRCRVTMNLVWTLEAHGDELQDDKNAADAQRQWTEARETLERSRCPVPEQRPKDSEQQDPQDPRSPEKKPEDQNGQDQQNQDKNGQDQQNQDKSPTDQRLQQKQRSAEAEKQNQPAPQTQQEQLDQRQQAAQQRQQRGGDDRGEGGTRQGRPSW